MILAVIPGKSSVREMPMPKSQGLEGGIGNRNEKLVCQRCPYYEAVIRKRISVLVKQEVRIIDRNQNT